MPVTANKTNTQTIHWWGWEAYAVLGLQSPAFSHEILSFPHASVWTRVLHRVGNKSPWTASISPNHSTTSRLHRTAPSITYPNSSNDIRDCLTSKNPQPHFAPLKHNRPEMAGRRKNRPPMATDAGQSNALNRLPAAVQSWAVQYPCCLFNNSPNGHKSPNKHDTINGSLILRGRQGFNEAIQQIKKSR